MHTRSRVSGKIHVFLVCMSHNLAKDKASYMNTIQDKVQSTQQLPYECFRQQNSVILPSSVANRLEKQKFTTHNQSNVCGFATQNSSITTLATFDDVI